MRLTTFKSVLDSATRLVGLTPSALSCEDKAHLSGLIAGEVKAGWEWGKDWPEWCPVVEVPSVATWSSGAAYAPGALVWYASDGRFYSATTTAAAGLTPPENPGVWTATDAPAALDLATVFGVYAADPRADRYALRLDWTLTPDGVLMPTAAAGTTVWIHYRPSAPTFTHEEWYSSTTYAPLDLVFDGADCYLALAASTGVAPSSDPSKWSLRPLPAVLADFAADSAASKWLKSRAQYEAAARLANDAELSLIRAYDRARGYGRRI